MFVRLKYRSLEGSKGYNMWVRSKSEVIQKLRRVGADPSDVFKLEIKKKGQDDYKEYDPVVLLDG